MPPRRRAPAPIPIDIEAVRRMLAEGKIVRVGISKSAQFPEGGTGRVRHVGNPEVDGEEFVQVELSLNGTRDILPFTPLDLTPAKRAKPPTETVISTPMARAKPTRAPATTASLSAKVPPPNASEAVPSGASVSASTGPVPADPSSVNPSDDGNGSATATGPRAKPPRSPRRSPPVSITIATTEAEPSQWRIEARIGARVVLRHGAVSPARVWELVRQLEEPTLISAVGGILDEQRKAAQKRADALTAELAKVRAELEALPGYQ